IRLVSRIDDVKSIVTVTKARQPVALSDEGSLLAAGIDATHVGIWSVSPQSAKLLPVAVLTVASWPASLAISHDGSLLVIGMDSAGAALWNIRDPRHPRPISSVPGMSSDVVALSPNGHLLAVALGPEVNLWDITDPTEPVAVTTLEGTN